MRDKNRLMGVLLSFLMVFSYMMPATTQYVKAAQLNTEYIVSISQGTSYLYPGDDFTLTIQLQLGEANIRKYGNYPADDSVYINSSAINTSKMTYRVEYYDTDESEVDRKHPSKIIISGLKYTGEGTDGSVTILTEGSSETPSSLYKDFTLSGMTLDETRDALGVDDSSNVYVKSDATQNAHVKVINQGKQVLKNVKVQLELAEKVEGIKIKTEEANISLLNPKEVKSASFAIQVDAEVKAKVYKATAIVNGVPFPVNLQVDSNIVPSALEVDIEENQIFMPGTTQTASVTVRNVGERPAKNIRVELSGDYVAVVGGSNVKHIAAINAHSTANLDYKLRIDGKTVQNTVPLKVDFTYLNSLGEETKDSQVIYLSTSASAVSSEVVIDNIVQPYGLYGVDQNFTVQFDVSAKGGMDGLKVSVKGDEGIVPKSQNLFFISKLKKGESKHYKVTLAATRMAVSSSHPIEITVEYGGLEKPIVVSQYTSVNISNPEKEELDADKDGTGIKKGLPKVIVGQYKSEPVVVKAGEKFDLEIGFLNAHKTKAVHNFKASLAVAEEGEKDTGTVFTPVGASNTFYISDLMPGQTQIKRIKLYTIPSAAPKTYEITIEMEYEDDKGNEVKATERIGIPVEQVTKVDIGDIQLQGAQSGMPSDLSTVIYNTGKTDISNMMIHIEGEGFTVQDNKVFVGSFEKGATQDYNPVIIAEAPGSYTGQIIVEYEEATGEHKQISKEFTMEVADMPAPEEMPAQDPNMVAPAHSKLPIIAGIVLGLVISIIVTVVIVKKRKAKKEKMMLDEDN